MNIKPAQRLTALPPYLFVEIDRKKRAALAAGRDVIDFGVGDPERPTPPFIVDALRAAAQNSAHHRYPAGAGSLEFRTAMAAFVQRRYGVSVDPQREVAALIGSKEGLAHLALALVNPGQAVLYPEPGYPVYRSGTIFAGGEPVPLVLREERDWLPDLESIPADVAHRAVLLFLNYPHNPTGATATLEFFERAVAFCKRHEIVLAHDAAYNEMYFEGVAPPPSVLQVAGAKDVAIELHSASKSFNMTGWRVGFAVGNADAVAALSWLKSNLDSGVFTAVQDAAIAAYAGIDSAPVRENLAVYGERVRVLAGGLVELGFRTRPPRATFYVWAGLPKGWDSQRAAARLLDEANIVCVPGVGFGPAGDGYVRFALTVSVERVREALTRMRNLKW
jgi:LL-diaminopimelate aminotransferase